MGHHSHDTNDKVGQLAIVAAVSALIGGLTALLLTPRNGEDTRRQIRDRMAATKDDMMQRFNTTKHDVQEDAETLVDNLDAAADATKTQVKGAAKTTKRTIRNAGSEPTDDLTDHIRKNGER